MGKPTAHIEQWYLFGNTLMGKAYGHPRFVNGTAVKTSGIVNRPDKPKFGDVIETRNTLYVLRTPAGQTKEDDDY